MFVERGFFDGVPVYDVKKGLGFRSTKLFFSLKALSSAPTKACQSELGVSSVQMMYGL